MSHHSKSLSIVHVTDSFFPESGGVERVVENLALQQIKAGHKVTVLCKETANTFKREEYKGINVYRYTRKDRPTPRNYATSYRGSAKAFRTILKTDRVDIVHCHLTLSSQGPIRIAKKNTIPLLASFYGPWDLEFLAETKELLARSNFLYKAYLRLQMSFQRKMQKRLLKNAQKVIVLSQHSIAQAGKILPGITSKLIKIPGGIEVDHFYPGENSGALRKMFGIDKDVFLIFTLRRLVHRMGVDLLVDAVYKCLSKGHNLALVVGGNGPLRDQLEDQVHRLGLSDKIFFTGFLHDSQLPDAYREADLFALPTRAEENFGLPILESAACGTPVIGTPVGSIPEVLGALDKNMLCKNPSAESIAEKLIEVFKNRDAIKNRFEKISNQVRKNYSWEFISKRVEDVYHEELSK